MPTCLYCTAAPADLGRYCSGCYGRVFHADGSPLVLGDPADPWRAFNAEADRAIADAKVHAVLGPRLAARWSFPVTVAAWKFRPKAQQRNTNRKESAMPMINSDKFKDVLAAKTAADEARSAVFTEWGGLSEAQKNNQAEAFGKRIDDAERNYYKACERVAEVLDFEIRRAE